MKEQHEFFPNALEALFLIVALFAIEYLVSGVLYDLRNVLGLDPRDIDPMVTLLGNGVLFSALLAYKRLTYTSLFHPSTNSVAATVSLLMVPILLLVPGIMLAMMAFDAVLVWWFPLSGWEKAMFDRMMSNGIASIASVCILAPVLEEMLFRGVILRSFLKQYPRSIAIFGSAAIFGLAHLNIYQFVVAFFVGSIAGWLYERTRSLWPCILLHASYNVVVTIEYLSMPAKSAQRFELTAIHWIGAAILAFAGSILLRRLLSPNLPVLERHEQRGKT